MWITRVSINNPVFATMVMIGIAVLGLFAYNRLRVEQMPDVSLPYVLVLTSYPGASPEVVEADVTKPLEYAINTVSGASLIRSNSKEGRSEVFAEFRMSTDMMKAMQDVRDKIGQVRTAFPRDVKEPLVLRIEQENAQPVVSLAVLSPTMSLRDLTSLTDQTIVKALENVPGVARIDVSGRVTRQILVQIKPNAVTSLGIGVDQVINAIRAANQDVPAGTHHPGTDRLDRARRGQDQGPGAVRPDHRRPAGRRAGLPVAGRGRHRRRKGGDVALADQRPPVHHDRHPEGAGREHRRYRSRHQRGDRHAADPPAVRRRIARRQFDGRRRRAERQPREVDHRRGRAPDGPHRLPLSAQLAQHDHHRTHAPDRGDRDVHRALRVRLHAQLPDADGAVALHRPSDRRRDRRAREHRAAPWPRQGSRHRGARRHRRDRPRGDGDDVRDRRRVRADRVHERHRRTVLLPVRAHRRRGRAGVAVRLVHARSDAVGGLARSSRLALCARASGSAGSWTASSAASSGCTRSTARPSSGRSVTARA